MRLRSSTQNRKMSCGRKNVRQLWKNESFWARMQSKQARSNNVNSNNNNSNNRWSTIKSSKKIYNVVETPRDNDKDVSMYNKFYGWLKDDMNDGDEEAQPTKQQQPPQ